MGEPAVKDSDTSTETAAEDVRAVHKAGTHRYDDCYDWTRLREPFAPDDIEWRVARSGVKTEKVWAQVLAYITNRAVMDRLDEVFGPANWRNSYEAGPSGGIVCGLSVRFGDEWLTKWDGAEETDIEKVKGGLSSAMKRAAVQWGIGRYLYDLPDGWAKVHDGGKHSDCVKATPKNKLEHDVWFKWDPPTLPAWAQPKPTKQKPQPVPNDTPDAPKPPSKKRGDVRTGEDWCDHMAEAHAMIELRKRWTAWEAVKDAYSQDERVRVLAAKNARKAEVGCQCEYEKDPDGELVCVHCGGVK